MIRAEISEKEMKETIVKFNKLKAGSLRGCTKLTNLQPDSSRKKERRIKSTKLEKGQITTDNAEIQRIMRLL